MICFFLNSKTKIVRTLIYFLFWSHSFQNLCIKAEEFKRMKARIRQKNNSIISKIKDIGNFKEFNKYLKQNKFRIQGKDFVEKLIDLKHINMKITESFRQQLKKTEYFESELYLLISKKYNECILESKRKQNLNKDEYSRGLLFLMELFEINGNQFRAFEKEENQILASDLCNLTMEGLCYIMEVFSCVNFITLNYINKVFSGWFLKLHYLLCRCYQKEVEGSRNATFDVEIFNLNKISLVLMERILSKEIKIEYSEAALKNSIDESAETKSSYCKKSNTISFQNKTLKTVFLMLLRELISFYNNFFYICVNSYFKLKRTNDEKLFDQIKIEKIKTMKITKKNNVNFLIITRILNILSAINKNMTTFSTFKMLKFEHESGINLQKKVSKLNKTSIEDQELVQVIENDLEEYLWDISDLYEIFEGIKTTKKYHFNNIHAIFASYSDYFRLLYTFHVYLMQCKT